MGMGQNLFELPPARTLQGSTWYGGWAFTDEDAQEIRSQADSLLGQLANLKKRAEALATSSTKADYLNRIAAQERTLFAMVASAAKGLTRSQYDATIKDLTIGVPKVIATLDPLIAADERDPTGKTSGAIISTRIKQIEAQQEQIAKSFAMDPMGWMQTKMTEGGKSVRDFQMTLFKEYLKTFWPWILIGGGILGTIYFWPLIAKFLAKQRLKMARKPGDLQPGTKHQPTERDDG